MNMREEFVEKTADAATLVHKRSYRQIGNLPIVEEISPLLSEYLPYEIGYSSPVLIGETISKIFFQIIATMEPEGMNRDTTGRRIYIYLDEYIKKGKELNIVADILGVSRSKFYEIKSEANDSFAAVLWYKTMEAMVERNVRGTEGDVRSPGSLVAKA